MKNLIVLLCLFFSLGVKAQEDKRRENYSTLIKKRNEVRAKDGLTFVLFGLPITPVAPIASITYLYIKVLIVYFLINRRVVLWVRK